MSNYIDIVFDGPPSHESPRFVEVESPAGRGIRFGEWVERPDGFWALRFSKSLVAAAPSPKWGAKPAALIGRLEALLSDLEFSRETHRQWRDCDQSYRDQNPDIGDDQFHAQMMNVYDERISVIVDAIECLKPRQQPPKPPGGDDE